MRSSAFSVSHSRVSSPESGAKRSPIPTPIPSPIRKFVVPRPLLYTTALLLRKQDPSCFEGKKGDKHQPSGVTCRAAVKRLYRDAGSNAPTACDPQMIYE